MPHDGIPTTTCPCQVAIQSRLPGWAGAPFLAEALASARPDGQRLEGTHVQEPLGFRSQAFDRLDRRPGDHERRDLAPGHDLARLDREAVVERVHTDPVERVHPPEPVRADAEEAATARDEAPLALGVRLHLDTLADHRGGEPLAGQLLRDVARLNL